MLQVYSVYIFIIPLNHSRCLAILHKAQSVEMRMRSRRQFTCARYYTLNIRILSLWYYIQYITDALSRNYFRCVKPESCYFVIGRINLAGIKSSLLYGIYMYIHIYIYRASRRAARACALLL